MSNEEPQGLWSPGGGWHFTRYWSGFDGDGNFITGSMYTHDDGRTAKTMGTASTDPELQAILQKNRADLLSRQRRLDRLFILQTVIILASIIVITAKVLRIPMLGQHAPISLFLLSIASIVLFLSRWVYRLFSGNEHLDI